MPIGRTTKEPQSSQAEDAATLGPDACSILAAAINLQALGTNPCTPRSVNRLSQIPARRSKSQENCAHQLSVGSQCTGQDASLDAPPALL